jgi:hypothetical protein
VQIPIISEKSIHRLRVAMTLGWFLGLKHKIIAQGKEFSDSLAGLSSADSQNQRTEIRLIRIN